MTLRTLGALGAVAILAAGLSGCGKLGELERPGPILGGKSNADAGPEPTRSIRTVDPRDRNSDPAPSRSAPIDSTSSDPGATSPQGVLDDPYARPK